MKLDIFDAYNIRARLCPSIIVLAPIPVTVFLCFADVISAEFSAVFLIILLAMANYIPLLQRRLQSKHTIHNYAADYLSKSDTTFDGLTKKRYYAKLAELSDTFSILTRSDNSDEHRHCCESAVIYLRNKTRDNHIVLEDNINLGFSKNMLASKKIGMTICVAVLVFIAWYVLPQYASFSEIPVNYYLAFGVNFLLLVFWLVGINKDMLEDACKRYAKTLISTIDTL